MPTIRIVTLGNLNRVINEIHLSKRAVAENLQDIKKWKDYENNNRILPGVKLQATCLQSGGGTCRWVWRRNRDNCLIRWRVWGGCWRGAGFLQKKSGQIPGGWRSFRTLEAWTSV